MFLLRPSRSQKYIVPVTWHGCPCIVLSCHHLPQAKKKTQETIKWKETQASVTLAFRSVAAPTKVFKFVKLILRPRSQQFSILNADWWVWTGSSRQRSTRTSVSHEDCFLSHRANFESIASPTCGCFICRIQALALPFRFFGSSSPRGPCTHGEPVSRWQRVPICDWSPSDSAVSPPEKGLVLTYMKVHCQCSVRFVKVLRILTFSQKYSCWVGRGLSCWLRLGRNWRVLLCDFLCGCTLCVAKVARQVWQYKNKSWGRRGRNPRQNFVPTFRRDETQQPTGHN